MFDLLELTVTDEYWLYHGLFVKHKNLLSDWGTIWYNNHMAKANESDHMDSHPY